MSLLAADMASPPDGFEGNLERPTAEATPIGSNFLEVRGWVYHKRQKISSLSVRVGENPPEPLYHGIARNDVLVAYGFSEFGGSSGFRGIVPLGSRAPRRIRLVIVATLQDGTSATIFRRGLRLLGKSEGRPPGASDFLGRLFGARMDGGSIIRRLGRWTAAGASYGSVFAARFLSEAARAMKKKRWPRSWGEFAIRWRAFRRKNVYLAFQGERMKAFDPASAYQKWLSHNALTEPVRRRLCDAPLARRPGPLISVVVPVYNTPRAFLRRLVSSVQAQIYPRWELCLADDASTESWIRPYLQELSSRDPRIRVVFRESNGHICEATNSAISAATGDYIALLDHDDELSPDALLHVAECLEANPGTDWVYTDEDKIDEQGRRYAPMFKGAWDPEAAITYNYTHHLSVIRASLVRGLGGMRKGFEGAQDLDLFLRVAEASSADKIRHVPYVCYHWRSHPQSTASDGLQKSYNFDSARRAIEEALARRGLEAEPFLPPRMGREGLCLHQLRWGPGPLSRTPVTIVIPTKDRPELLQACVASLEKTVSPESARLLIVDDRSADPKALRLLKRIERHCALPARVLRPKRGDGAFNFARLINEASEHVETGAMLLLNNDITALAPGWLEDMAGWLSVPGVGAVGARLLYPNRKVQHAGVMIGPHAGLPDHCFARAGEDDLGYLFQSQCARNVSAVTAACLLLRVEDFRGMGGMDEKAFAVAYNDVDLCLRLREAGKRVVYTPQSVLLHHESASRGEAYDPRELNAFVRKYQGYSDPFLNPRLDRESTAFALDPHACDHVERVPPLKVLFLTHNLNLEGAPVFAFELAKHLSEREGFSVLTVSPSDGPFRERYERRGLPVRILDESFSPDGSLEQFRPGVARLAREFAGFDPDLVVCNTGLTFWGLELARQMGKPALWHIHENVVHPPMLTKMADLFELATRIHVPSIATAFMYRPFDRQDKIRVLPLGLPLDEIETHRRKNDKAGLRRKLGLPESSRIVVTVGTVCERKGQHVLVEAARSLLAGRSEDLLFVMVGAKEGPYVDAIRLQMRSVGETHFRLVPETGDVYDYLGASDVFACASFDDVIPLAMQEAMAFALPVVTTDVYGIPEMIRHKVNGILVNPGQPESLARGIREVLDDPESAARLGLNAWETVHRKSRVEKNLPRIARLYREAALRHSATPIPIGEHQRR